MSLPKESSEKAFNDWAVYYKKVAEFETSITWPSEPLVRMFKGNYIPKMVKEYSGKKVLEIGFGDGNNLNFLGSLGLDLSGIEVHQEICDSTKAQLANIGRKSDLKKGDNRNIPFQENFFDYLVSWNCIHYENTEDKMVAAIAEHARVLKPGGRIFISTVAPDNKILKDATSLGGHRFQIGVADDFRKGQVYFYFETESEIKRYFSKHFSDILVGRVRDHMFTETLDWFIITGIKK